MSMTATTGELLASYFQEQAAWYQSCCRADTPRATTLEHFADFLHRLPADDLRALALRELAGCGHGPFTLEPGPQLSSSISQIDDYQPGRFDAFLDLLVHAAVSDCIEQDEQPALLLVRSLDESHADLSYY